MQFLDDATVALKEDIKVVRAKLQRTPMMARHGEKYNALEDQFNELKELLSTARDLRKLGEYMKLKGISS